MTLRFRLNGKVYVYRGRRRNQPETRKGKVIDFREVMRRRRMEALRNPQDAA